MDFDGALYFVYQQKLIHDWKFDLLLPQNCVVLLVVPRPFSPDERSLFSTPLAWKSFSDRLIWLIWVLYFTFYMSDIDMYDSSDYLFCMVSTLSLNISLSKCNAAKITKSKWRAPATTGKQLWSIFRPLWHYVPCPEVKKGLLSCRSHPTSGAHSEFGLIL